MTLAPGDPAAILNAETGELTWMAVNADEEAQVGHYYLLKRDYERAWRWYERSIDERVSSGPLQGDGLSSFWLQFLRQRDAAFFEAYCLRKLGRDAEAGERLRRFRRAFSFDVEGLARRIPPTNPPRGEAEQAALRAELEAAAAFVTPLMRDVYATEVFLSLDATDDGVAYFQQQLRDAATDADRYAAALCLGQLLLAAGDRRQFANLTTDTLAPLLMSLRASHKLDADNAASQANRLGVEFLLSVSGGCAVLPLMSPEFLSEFSSAQLRELQSRWKALRNQAQDDVERHVSDLILLAFAKRLGEDAEREALEQRLRSDLKSTGGPALDDPNNIEAYLDTLRETDVLFAP